MLTEFANAVHVANDDELVTVQDAAGFLKRSFVSVELSEFPDGDNGDDGDERTDSDKGPPSGRKRPQSKRRGAPKTALETDLEGIVGKLRL